MNLELKKLTSARWPSLEKLFGKNGACGGCWCMHWRMELGEKSKAPVEPDRASFASGLFERSCAQALQGAR